MTVKLKMTLTVVLILNYIGRTGLAIQVALCTWIRFDIPQQRITNLEFDTLGSAQNHIQSMSFDLAIKKKTCYLILAYKNTKISNNIFFLQKVSSIYETIYNTAKRNNFIY